MKEESKYYSESMEEIWNRIIGFNYFETKKKVKPKNKAGKLKGRYSKGQGVNARG